MQLADALVSTLRDLELGYLFGVSGANIEHVHDAVYRLGGNRFNTVMTKSEYGAAFMADARARVHRTLGVCCATSGGGMMNLAVGIAESYAQEVPVLAIVGQPPLTQEGRGAFQDSSGLGHTVNAVQMWSAIAKHVCKITDASQFWSQFQEALIQPFEGRCGPAVMLIPRDLMTADVGAMPKHFPQSLDACRRNSQGNSGHQLFLSQAPFSQAPFSQALCSIWQDLARARAPLLIAGSGVAREGVEALVQKWVALTGITVATTLACTNAFPQNDPHYIGMIGAAGHPSAHDFLENQADYVLALGTQLRAMNRATLEQALQRKPLAVINPSTDALDSHFQSKYVVNTSVRQCLDFFLAKQSLQPLEWGGFRLPLQFQPPETPIISASTAKQKVLTQHDALLRLQTTLPLFRHVLFDAGNCATTAAHYLRMPTNISTTIALGMGGMGYAIAGAIGAQLGEASSCRTLVIGGDGAFMITGLEIHTAVDLQLPILWVIFNNNQHGMCVTRQRLYFAGRIEGNTYSTLDIAQIARGFGSADTLWSASAQCPDDLQQALTEYLARKPGPGVLELKISNDELPPFRSFLSTQAALV